MHMGPIFHSDDISCNMLKALYGAAGEVHTLQDTYSIHHHDDSGESDVDNEDGNKDG